MLLALAIFISAYAAMVILPRYRAYVAFAAAASFVALGILPAGMLLSSVDWNVLLMIAGTMGIANLFIESRMPARLADLIIMRFPSVLWSTVMLSLLAGLISAFVDNVATVLMLAPVAISMAVKLGISPVPSVIAIAVASNLEGAATLVGDTTSILLGGYAGMDFLDFFWFMGRPGMFWVVQAGLVASTAVLIMIFMRQRDSARIEGATEVRDYFPTLLLVSAIVLLILASFIPGKPAMTNGLICTALFAAGLIRDAIRRKRLSVLRYSLLQLDYFTLLLLASLFVLIEGIKQAGVIDAMADLIMLLGGSSPFIMYSVLLWASVLFSAFVDNIPFVAAMLPVASIIAARMGIEPYVLYFGLLSGATLGGNMTPIGASANIMAIGILKKHGYDVSNRQYMRIGIPYTLAAVTTAYALVWLIWG